MKKTPKILFLVGLFILNFLALNDITKGNEDNYFLEYGVIIVSAVLLISMLAKRRKYKQKGFNAKKQ